MRFNLLRVYSWLMAALIVMPIAVVVTVSLTAEGSVRFPPQHWGLRWFLEAFTERSFVQAFLFSVEAAAAVAVIASVLGLTSALALVRYSFRGSKFIQGFVMAPLLLPHLVIAIGLLQLFAALGITTSPGGLIAGHVAVVFPFVLRLSLGGLAGIDPNVEKAAYTLGATRLYVFRRVTLPLMASPVLSGAVMAFLLSFDETVISIFTSVPGRTTLPVMIFNYAEQRSDPLIAAVSSIMVIVAIIAIAIADRSVGLLNLLSGGQVGELNELNH